MRFTETNHGFELSRCSCDALLTRPDILAQFSHLDVLLNQLLSCFVRNVRFYSFPSVGDVGRKQFDRLVLVLLQMSRYDNVLRSGIMGSILQVHADDM
jgi:hypothetical protein